MQSLLKMHEVTPTQRAPTADEIRAAAGSRIPDLIAPGLRALFCGINPGLYSAATKQHFARPGNRFWPALHLAGFTASVLAPNESGDLLELGYGITSLVRRATATAREVAPSEFVAGRRRLARIVSIYRHAGLPFWVSVRTAWRSANHARRSARSRILLGTRAYGCFPARVVQMEATRWWSLSVSCANFMPQSIRQNPSDDSDTNGCNA